MPPRKASTTTSATKRTTATKVEKRSKPSSTSSPSPPPEKLPKSVTMTGDSDLSELDEAEEEEEEGPKKKKAKKATAATKKGPVTPIHADLPNNTTFPEPLEPFPRPRGEGTLRISSWNVAGLKACEKKGFSKYVEAEDADILCLNETKCESLKLDSIENRYPYRYWGIHHKKGQAGVAIFSKIEPLEVTKGLPPPFSAVGEGGEVSLEKEETLQEGEVRGPSQKESEGRIITLEFEKSYLVATYVPNAGQGLKTLPEKAAWNKAFEKYLFALDAKKPVMWIGDLNVVPSELDIRNWKTNYNKSAGVTDTEIDGFKRQLAGGQSGFVDVWRDRNEGVVGNYSYFSYKFQCRMKGIGWRIDMAVVSKRVLDKVEQCEIRQTIYGASDHVPIILDVQGPL